MGDRLGKWKKSARILLGLGAPLVGGVGAAAGALVVGGTGRGTDGTSNALGVLTNSESPEGGNAFTLERPINAGAPDLFAGHSSHSSHASHASHSSSSGGGGTYQAPLYSPPRLYGSPGEAAPLLCLAARALARATVAALVREGQLRMPREESARSRPGVS